MALNPSGRISIGGDIVGESINLELNLLADTNSSLNDPAFRTLAGIPEGTISLADFYGKSNVIVIPPIDTNTCNLVIDANEIPGYVAGSAKIELTVDSGTYLYSCDIALPAIDFINFTIGDQITLTNNGYIMGMGGNGAVGIYWVAGPGAIYTPAQNGGNAISLSCPIVIQNNGYIGGGGGGGGATQHDFGWGSGGGGGAGGGTGGAVTGLGGSGQPSVTAVGGAGGAPGAAGQNGAGAKYLISDVDIGGGGGGGRIMPGTGGAGGDGWLAATPAPCGGRGGGAGGGGGGSWAGLDYNSAAHGGIGGSAGAAGGTGRRYQYGGQYSSQGGGGGGGWGASGATCINVLVYEQFPVVGGIGGRAIKLNSFLNTATITGPGIVYGAIS